MPSVIDEWLASPKCHTYGIEADGRIVAIGNLRLVDRNKTGWMEGLRVHPDYRRRGYADMLTQHFLSLGKALRVQRLRYTTAGNNRASLKLAKKAGFKRLFKMSAVWHEDLNITSISAHTHTTIKEATPQEAYELSKTCPSLFPSNMFSSTTGRRLIPRCRVSGKSAETTLSTSPREKAQWQRLRSATQDQNPSTDAGASQSTRQTKMVS